MEIIPIIVVVDDDESVRRALKRLLSTAGYVVEAYAGASEILQRDPLNGPGCLILDVRMPELSGLQLQDSLRALGHVTPVVFITGHGDIETGVRAMKTGAVDFLAKPFGEEVLLEAVKRALIRDAEVRRESEELTDLLCRYHALTPREREVCNLVATGRLNKQVAAVLGTSEKTVKVHRARVMRKMRADSLAELVRSVDRLTRSPGEADREVSRRVESDGISPMSGVQSSQGYLQRLGLAGHHPLVQDEVMRPGGRV